MDGSRGSILGYRHTHLACLMSSGPSLPHVLPSDCEARVHGNPFLPHREAGSDPNSQLRVAM